jgi:hypothetical protein
MRPLGRLVPMKNDDALGRIVDQMVQTKPDK